MLPSAERRAGVRRQLMSRKSSTTARETSRIASIEGSFTRRFAQLLTGMIDSLRMIWTSRYFQVQALVARD